MEPLEKVAELYWDNPLGFVLFAYPWGDGELKDETGPDTWQAEELENIGNQVKAGKWPIQMAIKSGHGPGKTAFLVWIIQWFMSTRPHPQAVVTANTGVQLETKTWREMAKWHKRSTLQPLFEWTATRYYLKAHPETWFASPITWNKDRAQAFSGTHEKHVLIIYDEASEIDDAIWEATEGALTTGWGAIWLVFGNPTKNTGRFYECFHRFEHRWIGRTIDSRTAKKADKDLLQRWVDDWGEDSNYVRVRVLGLFPTAGSNQLIPMDVVQTAQARKYTETQVRYAPVVMGVDVGRFGMDKSVVYVRQGYATLEVRKVHGLDGPSLANLISGMNSIYHPDAIFIDELGVGASPVDHMRLIGLKFIPVNVGKKAKFPEKFKNLRAEIWAATRDWLMAGGAIPYDSELVRDLTEPQYDFTSKNQIILESKDDMRSRGVPSPDIGDALALTFTHEVRKDSSYNIYVPKRTAIIDYDVHAPMSMEMGA